MYKQIVIKQRGKCLGRIGPRALQRCLGGTSDPAGARGVREEGNFWKGTTLS